MKWYPHPEAEALEGLAACLEGRQNRRDLSEWARRTIGEWDRSSGPLLLASCVCVENPAGSEGEPFLRNQDICLLIAEAEGYLKSVRLRRAPDIQVFPRKEYSIFQILENRYRNPRNWLEKLRDRMGIRRIPSEVYRTKRFVLTNTDEAAMNDLLEGRLLRDVDTIGCVSSALIGFRYPLLKIEVRPRFCSLPKFTLEVAEQLSGSDEVRALLEFLKRS